MFFFYNLSIKYKLVLIILFVSILASSFGFVISSILTMRSNRNTMVNNMRMNARLVSDYCVPTLVFFNKEGAEEELAKLEIIPSIRNAIIYDDSGNVFVEFRKDKDEFASPRPINGSVQFFRGNFLHVFEPINYRGVSYGTIYLRVSTEDLSKRMTQSILTYISIFLGIILISYIFALNFQRIISGPILQLAAITDQISSNPDLSMRLEIKGSDEISILFNRFNMMLTQLHHRELERDKAETEIKASLKEKEVLLKEVHHRVKNNLQVISSLLNLQSRYIKDETTLTIFQESKNRIRSMALIHEKLYRSEDIASINFKDYIKSLTMDLRHSYGLDGSNCASLNLDVEELFLSIDSAVPCGLVINELISNAFKYAFKDFSCDDKAEILIRMRTNEDSEIHLTIADNGKGIPPEIDIRNTSSLGLRLATILVEEQLSGKIDVKRGKGTEFDITFSAK